MTNAAFGDLRTGTRRPEERPSRRAMAVHAAVGGRNTNRAADVTADLQRRHSRRSAAAPPPVLPPGVRSRSHGLLVRPYTGLSACQSVSATGTLVLPSRQAPAANTRAAIGPSLAGDDRPTGGSRPTGADRRPASTPSTSSATRAAGRAGPTPAPRRRRSPTPVPARRSAPDRVELSVVLVDPLEVHVDQLDRADDAGVERSQHL